MAYKQMIAPCGVDCARCVRYLANENPAALVQVEKWSALLNIPIQAITSKGCRAQARQISLQTHLFGDNHRCSIYGCEQRKKAEYSGFCEKFPYGKRHPYLEKNELLNKNAKALFCP